MQHLVKQRKILLTRLVAGGNFVKGSITCVCGICGRSHCICKTKAGTKAYRLTYKDSGQKTQIVYIPRNRLSEMSNDRQLRSGKIPYAENHRDQHRHLQKGSDSGLSCG